MAENFQQTADALFRGMEDFITSKTVVGEPIHVHGTTIVPLVDVTFGVAASTKAESQRHNGGGGMGGKMTPTALLVIKDGNVRLMSIKNQDAVTRLIDVVPDLVNRFTGGNNTDPEVQSAIDEAGSKEETF